MSAPVIIVGASSSGLFAAYLLARAGIPVQLFEQAERLAPAPRSLIVTADMNRALGFVPEPAIVNHVQAFELHAADARSRVTLRTPDLIVERAELTRCLASMAELAGATIEYGWQFESLELDRDRTVAVLGRRGADRKRQVATRFVIGADGGHSSMARVLGQPPRQNVSVVQARVALPPGFEPGLSQVWFAPRETRYFYWLIPESPTVGAVGIVDDIASEARPKLDRFLRAHGLEPIEYQGAQIAMYDPRPAPAGQVGYARIYLVGDAAGQVKVTTVGGTVTGFWGARAAARAILHENGYRRELRPVARELHLHWLIRRLLNRFKDEHYGQLLRSLNDRVRMVLGSRNRDVMTTAFASVLAAEPRLMLLAARALVR